MVKAPEGNPYNSLLHTVACRITGCAARISDPVLHERIFHWGKPICECQVCVLSRKELVKPKLPSQKQLVEKLVPDKVTVKPDGQPDQKPLSLAQWA
jgi:hypothetical protein